MITFEEQQKKFMEAVFTTEFENSQKILSRFGTELTIYSYDEKMVADLLTSDNKKQEEIASLIKRANVEKRQIREIIKDEEERKRRNEVMQEEIEEFFNIVDSPDTKQRLFILAGESGTGKTTLVTRRYPDAPVVSCDESLDPYSLFYFLADTDGTGLKPHETPLLKALKKKDSKKDSSIVIMDEINELPSESLMMIRGITDEKKSIVIGKEVVEIDPNFKLICTMNPPSETDERKSLGDALLRRAVGYIVELTDEVLCSRLGVDMSLINAIRRLYNFLRNSGMVDSRDLTYSDYEMFINYNFEAQMKFKLCIGDMQNIAAYNRIKQTQEYNDCVKVIKDLIAERKAKK